MAAAAILAVFNMIFVLVLCQPEMPTSQFMHSFLGEHDYHIKVEEISAVQFLEESGVVTDSFVVNNHTYIDQQSDIVEDRTTVTDGFVVNNHTYSDLQSDIVEDRTTSFEQDKSDMQKPEELVQNTNCYGGLEIETYERFNQNEYLLQFGLKRYHIFGDGNCLFRSISFAVEGTEENYDYYRQIAVTHIRHNSNDFAMFFTPENPSESQEQYMERSLNLLSQNYQYAGFECVLALSQALQRNILITQGGASGISSVRTIPSNENSNFNRYINLIYSSDAGGHYDLAVDRDGITNNTPITNLEKEEIITENYERGDVLTANSESEVKCHDHLHSVKKNDSKVVKQNLSKNFCDICSIQFSTPFNYRRHCLRKHKIRTNQKKKSLSYISCLHPSCNLKFFKVIDMINHIEKCHKYHIKIANLEFKSDEEFMSWKLSEESKNSVQFSQCTKSKFLKGIISLQYVCNRNGFVRETKDRKRAKRRKGSCKINSICPARMFVTKSVDQVNVKYIQSHSHTLGTEESRYLQIPDNVKTLIMTQLSLGVPISKILENLKDDACNLDNRDSNSLKQCQLITRKDVRNIKRRYLNLSSDKHENDAVSVALKVKKLQELSNDPVLLFKQQFISVPGISLSKNDFMLILMTKEQVDCYKKFAPTVICLDATHGTNQYRFYLNTLLVVNDQYKGIPVAFCITNRDDEIANTIFLQTVKQKCPNTKIDCILTDDTHAGFNAARSTFGNDVKHYLCIYHIITAWGRKLKSMYGKETSATLLCHLRKLIYSKTELEFQLILNDFEYLYKDQYTSFYQYFVNNYLPRKEKWALHYRKLGLRNRITTNNHLESFHRTLKHIYFDGKQNHRLDELIDVLLKYEDNCYIEQLRLSRMKQTSDLIDKSGRHKNSLLISDDNVCAINEETYTVESSENDLLYRVILLKKSCSISPCYISCNVKPCQKLCPHLYTCNCRDTNPCCKHIHKVHSIVCSGMPFAENPEDSELMETEIYTEEQNLKQSSHKREIYRFHSNVEFLKKQMENSNLFSRFTTLNKALESLIADNNAYLSVAVSMPKLQKRKKLPPNKKPEKQPKYKATQKKKGRQGQKQSLLKDSSGTVKEYPPLRLVQRSVPPQQPVSELNRNLFVNGDGIQVPNNLIAPPSLHSTWTEDSRVRRMKIVFMHPKKEVKKKGIDDDEI